jgi:hypothetical protein
MYVSSNLMSKYVYENSFISVWYGGEGMKESGGGGEFKYDVLDVL